MRSFCVALTGGIGAGKTTASAVFQKFGAFVINVDAVGHDVLECSSNEYQMIIEVFGESILNPNKTINRQALGKVVFNSETQLEKLEAITHPGINARLLNILKNQTAEIVILDMAVLVERPLAYINGKPLYRKVVVVEAPLEERVRRLQERGLSSQDALARIRSQVTDDKRREIADLIIFNDGSLTNLESKLQSHWETLLEWVK
ncbi:MAG: dephospho-CoA kinase [Acidimicrobiaceae bacterium]|jgi:dephospho-CoA kinase|nr:dephospho-CoA kinase [Acidimicrobiaceae bacterium]|tara:strand:+ start:74601 stop:75212 length:612 start_codon:yes stop_codon:yes gene_type:complete